jgi:hypothetical protein
MAAMLLLTLLIIAGPEMIFVNQISQYLGYIMLGTFGLGFIFLIFNQPRLMMFTYALCCTVGVFLKNESNGDLLFPKDNNTHKLTVCHINLSNVEHREDLIKTLNESNIDVVSFQEFTPEWTNFFKTNLSNQYPYYYEAMKLDPYGKAIYSKFPITIKDTLSKAYAFDLVYSVVKEQEQYTMVSTYLTPSLNNTSSTLAKTQLKNICEKVGESGKKLIVFGEFNMVYWANEIRKFRQITQLNNCRKDVIPASLRIPNDHAFYSKDLQCTSVRDLLINKNERVGLITGFQQNIATRSHSMAIE